MIYLKIHSGNEVEEEVIRQMHEMRKEFVEVKPDVKPEDEFEAYRSFIRGCKFVYVLWDSTTKQVVGGSGAQQNGGWWFPDEGFIKGHARRSLASQLMFLHWSISIRLARPKPEMVVTMSFPTGFTRFRSISRYLLFNDPDISPEDRQAFLDVSKYFPSIDINNGIVRTLVIPKMDYKPYDPESKKMFEIYDKYCPNWRHGYCLVALIRPKDQKKIGFIRALRYSLKRVLK